MNQRTFAGPWTWTTIVGLSNQKRLKKESKTKHTKNQRLAKVGVCVEKGGG